MATPFIGRERDITEIGALLDTCRLLTLVGPGGIGKTRLALEVTARKSAAFADGSIFVALAPLSSPENIPTAIGGAFSIHLDANTDVASQILNYLRDKTLLLILDNFEHLLDGAAFVAGILQAAPDVRILATSREPLNLQDEWLWQVKGLPFPGDENSAGFGDYDAVRLFVERARRVRHDFDVQVEATYVIRICRLVEGMPLAVELAAGWLKTLTCKQIGEQIQRNLDILVSPARDAPSRHRSIRAVFDHSWNLLTEEQQAVFRRLSVFRGGFTLAAAEKVARGSLWMLASLVDKSLIHFDSAGRYSIHELLRQYGEEKLTAAGEMVSVQDAHSAYFLDFMAQRLPDVKGGRQYEAVREIDADLENIRVAWLRGVDRKDMQSLDAALDTLYIFVNHLRTQHRFVFRQVMLQYALDSFDPNESHTMYRFWWRLKARYFGNSIRSSSPLAECLEIARAENDAAEIAFCLEWLGFGLFAGDGYNSAAEACLEEAVELHRAHSDLYNLAWCLYTIGLSAGNTGDADKSDRAFQESLDIRQEIGDQIGQAWSDWMLYSSDDVDDEIRKDEESYQFFTSMDFYAGMSHVQVAKAPRLFFKGDFTAAQPCAEEAFSLARKYNYSYMAGAALSTLALLACMEARYQEAKRLCGAARKVSNDDPLLEYGIQVTEAMSNFGLENYDAAAQEYQAALATLLRRNGKRSTLLPPVTALLAAHDGQVVWACEILALAFNQPKSRTGWLDKWDLIAALRSDLERELGADEFAAAWERGAKLDLEATVRRILAGADTLVEGTKEDKKISAMLPETLTERELEILRLLAAGLSNRQIARDLFLALGTVKAYVHKLYGKLGVESRTQAVARARELDLL